MITHIVLVKFKTTATAADRSRVDEMVISMKHLCLPSEGLGQEYITSIVTGPQDSTEGLSEADYGFVVTFANAACRDYYVNEDPFHQSVKDMLGPLVDKVEVFDIAH